MLHIDPNYHVYCIYVIIKIYKGPLEVVSGQIITVLAQRGLFCKILFKKTSQ